MGSDGIFDNLSDAQIVAVLARMCGDEAIEERRDAQTRQFFFHNRATRRTGDTWSEVAPRGHEAAAQALVDAARRGAKKDDITAAVLRVDRAPPARR